MENLKNINLEELALLDLMNVNGGSVDESSIGYRLGAASARTLGNILGLGTAAAKLVHDAIVGKMIDSFF